MAIESWPAALRAHGIPVQLHNGFPNTPKPKGDMPDKIASFFWHHDATPKGATPGGLTWLINAYNAGNPSAQIWIDTVGVWHFGGAGYASHAGVVRGNLNSSNSVGAETDHTTFEGYYPAQIDSIRKGVAVCAIQEGRNSDWLTFHKIEAKPRGRKPDPYFDEVSNNMNNWDAELSRERGIVQRYIDEIKGGGEITPPDITEDELSAAEVQAITGEIEKLKNLLIEPKYQTGGHTVRDEAQWISKQEILPAIKKLDEKLNEIRGMIQGGMPKDQSNFHWLGNKVDEISEQIETLSHPKS